MNIPVTIDPCWGEREITAFDAQAFADEFGPTEVDRTAIATTLERFPLACQVRGMFFEGLANVIRKRIGAAETNELMERVGVPRRYVGFALYPHRDFYKLYFAATPRIHPNISFDDGVRRIAETFYPVFRESLLGRTLAPLMGRDGVTVLARLAQAYSISVPWNEHVVKPNYSGVTWECRVEPSAFYPSTHLGIVQGTLTSHDLRAASVEIVSSQHFTSEIRYTFEICW